MQPFVNLIVDLDHPSIPPAVDAAAAAAALPGVEIDSPPAADDRTLAWIDDAFSGTWGAEAFAGTNVVARCAGGAPVGFATLDASGLRFPWLECLARERDVGLFGPFGVAQQWRKGPLGRALLRAALAALRARGYARALIPAVAGERLIRYYADAVGARVAERFDPAALLGPPARTLVLASGNGSNLHGVLDGIGSGALHLTVTGLVTNDPNAYAIERARRAGIAAVHVLPWNRREEPRANYDARLLDTVAAERPQLLLLLGWMHLLADPFVRAFPEMLNLHPAFLPLDYRHDDVGMPDGTRMRAFRGPRAVRDALGASSRWVGATVHRVTADTDRGPVLARKPLRVEPGDDERRVMERLHPLERRVVGAAIVRWSFECRPKPA